MLNRHKDRQVNKTGDIIINKKQPVILFHGPIKYNYLAYRPSITGIRTTAKLRLIIDP